MLFNIVITALCIFLSAIKKLDYVVLIKFYCIHSSIGMLFC